MGTSLHVKLILIQCFKGWLQPLFFVIKMAKSPVTFLKEVRDELKKVVWPSREEVTRLTLIVIIVSLLVGVFLGGLDFVFAKLLALVAK